MHEFLSVWLQIKTDRRAVTALEYGLIAALIAAAIVTSVTLLGTNITGIFSGLATKFNITP